MEFDEPIPGQTPIDDISGLRDRSITTQAELNAAEAENIRKAVLKYLIAKPTKRSALGADQVGIVPRIADRHEVERRHVRDGGWGHRGGRQQRGGDGACCRLALSIERLPDCSWNVRTNI
jgi:hypothetical protein